ncbi:Argonaute linker 1 domain [Trinorchestia longiramus]|nr:Argonaute linker 1 domain [Trinorchestia longiramus]
MEEVNATTALDFLCVRDSKLAIPLRREHEEGTIGTKIKLKSNYFKIGFAEKDTIIYHFDVKITDTPCIQEDDLCKKNENNGALSASDPSLAAPKPNSVNKKKKKKKKGNSNCPSTNTDTGTSKASRAITESTPASSCRWIPKTLKQKIFEAFIQEKSVSDQIFENRIMAYDGGSSAYSTAIPTPLKKDGLVEKFEFKDPERDRKKTYKIEWKRVEYAKLGKLLSHVHKKQHMPKACQTICQALEVMFNYERTKRFTAASYNRFFSPDEKLFGRNFNIGSGKEGVVGFAMSLRLCQGWKDAGALLLNIDVSHAAFYRPLPVLEYLKTRPDGDKLFRDPTKPLSSDAITVIENEIIKKNIKVQMMKTKQSYQRKYSVKEVSPQGPGAHKFEVERGNPASLRTVIEYFEEKYKITLVYPELNCFIMTNGAQVPIEVCQIAPKQLVKEKLSNNEPKEFIKNTAVKPKDRQEMIKDTLNKNKFDEDPVLRHLGVSIENDLVSTDGRLLPPPVVKLQNCHDVNNGVWDTGSKDKFKQSATLNYWGLLNVSSHPKAHERTEELKKKLIAVAKRKGMNPQEPLFDENLSGDHNKNIASFLRNYKKGNTELQLVVFIMDKGNQKFYDLMKSLCESELKIATQCVLVKTLERITDLLITNILLKINAKLGEISQVAFYKKEIRCNYMDKLPLDTSSPSLSLLSLDGVMVMGADANHPAGGDKVSPSMVAVVASVDKFASSYVNEVHQTARLDIIEDMQEITQNLLEQYRTRTKRLPIRIIMYRDGVSDTQFTTVLACELKAMRDACARFGKDYKPPMTFMCVQKRHHTRLFCEDERDTDKSGNVRAGTVVDTVITTHSNRNFFLCSHGGIQGTSKPAHYTVLWDDSDLNMDHLQLLTNSLCHNYARCFRAVSLPSPVLYADRAAYRAKTRLEGAIEQAKHKWEKALFSSKDGKYPEEYLRAAIRIDKSMEASRKMYFV